MNTQAPGQDYSLSRGTFFFHNRRVNPCGLEEPFCMDNKTDEVLLRHNIILVFCPEILWTPNFYLQPIILFCKVPKGSIHTMQTKCNRAEFYTFLWPQTLKWNSGKPSWSMRDYFILKVDMLICYLSLKRWTVSCMILRAQFLIHEFIPVMAQRGPWLEGHNFQA